MILQIYCAQCGKEKEIAVNTAVPIPSIIELILRAKWISQQNGENLDIYCSRKCAL